MAKRGRPKSRRVHEGDQESTAAPPLPASSPPQIPSQTEQIIRYSARLAKKSPLHGPLRSPIRNVRPVRKIILESCPSSASSPHKNIDDVKENLNHQEEFVSSPNLDMPVVLETLVAPQSPPNKNPVQQSTTIVNYTEIRKCKANDGFDSNRVESVNPKLALVNVGNVPPIQKFSAERCGSSTSKYQKEQLVSGPNCDMPVVLETLVAPQQPPNQNSLPRSTTNVNYTQIGEREANGGFGPDEVESVNPEMALVNVDRYRVNKEIAPILRAIIKKYGDIGEKSIFKSHESLIFHFERICWAYNELKHKNHTNFPSVERKRIADILKDAAAVHITVDWFQKRLDEIENAFQRSKEYIALKDKVLEFSAVTARLEEDLKKRKEVEEVLAKQLKCAKGEMAITFGRPFVTNLVHLD